MKYIVLQSSGGFLRLLRSFVKKYLQIIIIILCLDRVCCLFYCFVGGGIGLNLMETYILFVIYYMKKNQCVRVNAFIQV